QAEVGIRVRNVTGVQTCALPIYVLLGPADSPRIQGDTVALDTWGISRTEENIGACGVVFRGREGNANACYIIGRAICDSTQEAEIGRTSCREGKGARQGGGRVEE